ncbi:MAG: sigma-54 dependent transcriptional regulator [Rhizobiaceae bacterium]
MSMTILIVDDEPVQRRLLENTIQKMGYRTVLAENGEQAIDRLRGVDGPAIGLIILDLVMPGLDGMGVLGKMQELGLERPVIVQTAQGGIDTVVSAIRAGAQDFCVKPVSMERLKVSIQNAMKFGAMEDAVKKIRKNVGGVFTFKDMIAESVAMEKVTKLGERAAGSTIPILIEGESGVGKEVIAKAIQGSGERKGKPFITVNCGALPENLVESILFGHEKGSFTGATNNHLGKFKEADGGTLFLDEVGELSLDIQVKLLRAIQEGEIDPVGAKHPVKTNFRLISATNRDMVEQVKLGEFREDLFYRLNVFPIHVPPLRERKSDIAALVRHFTARICLEEGRRNIAGIRTDALAMLEAYDWPGNIRQLENTIFRAIILCDGEELTIEEFPQVAMAMGVDEGVEEQAGLGEENHRVTLLSQVAPMAPDMLDLTSRLDLINEGGDVRTLDDVERELIKYTLDHHKGRMTKVARSLGIGRSTLYRKLKEYDLEETESVK